MKKDPRDRGRPRHILPIIFALVVAIAPHLPGLPPWISLWCLVMWSYMLLHLKTTWPLPGPGLCRILALVGIVGIFFTFQVRINGDAFVGLLAVMAAVKPFEMPNHRHRMIAILLTYFIVVTSLFRWDSLWAFFHLFTSVFVTTIALVRINHPMGAFRDSIRLTSRIMVRAVPLTLLLFLLFPRLPGSFFGLREDPFAGRAGFSEQIRPGSLFRLTRDDSLAFRAVFEQPLPPGVGLYWRTLVFDVFDGRTWKHRQVQPHGGGEEVYLPGGHLYYTIHMEPHRSRWLPALDLPEIPPRGSRLTHVFTLQAEAPVVKALEYRLTSRVPPALTDWEGRARTLRNVREESGLANPGADLVKAGRHGRPWAREGVPGDPERVDVVFTANPDSVALARELAQGAGSVEEVVVRFLLHFRDQGFAYSLSPARLGRSPLDQFLLETRRGYCEHYAAAFAYMMNAVGIPARVVGGYLGGELNPYGNYVTVLNAYAHAWTEIRHPVRGWVRVDPTLAVSPERLSRNPDGSLSSPAMDGEGISFLMKLRWGLEAANMGWEAWFSGYASGEQKALLRRLGFDTAMGSRWWKMPLATGGVLVGILTMTLVIWRLMGWRQKDRVAVAYGLFCRRLEGLDIHRKPHHGALAFGRVAARKRPDLAPAIGEIVDLYLAIRYGPVPSRENRKEQIRELGRRVNAFRPSARPR